MPCINKGFSYWASMEEDWQLDRSVFHRLLENASRIMEKKEIQEKLAHRPLDPRTGRELYKPITGRKPINVSHLPEDFDMLLEDDATSFLESNFGFRKLNLHENLGCKVQAHQCSKSSTLKVFIWNLFAGEKPSAFANWGISVQKEVRF